jgi:hypothetical protein
MALIFSLSAECGPTQEAADSFADHFNESSWVSSGEEAWKCNTQVFQDGEDNWWCMVCPSGIATDRKLRTTINSQSTLLKASTADLS